jgi:hypothetical protein
MNLRSTPNAAVHRHLDTVASSLLLIMMAGLWLIPAHVIPSGTWLIGAGSVLLSLNVARALNGIPMSAFATILGLVAFGLGLFDLVRVGVLLEPILVSLLGADSLPTC